MAVVASATAPVCAPMGEPGKYNGFFFGPFTAPSSDVQGRLAASGNISLNNYSIADQLPANTVGGTLVSGGNITWPSGRLYAGDIIAAGSAAGVGAPVRNGLSASQHVIDHATLPVDFAAELSRTKAWSSALAALTTNTTYVSQYGGLNLHGDSHSAVQVFALPGNLVLNANNFTLDNVPADATLVFNISGTSAGIKNVSLEAMTPFRQRVVYNFYQATSLQFAGIAVQGTVLAPLADITNPQGVVWGGVIAKSWNGPMQINNAALTACGLPAYSANTAPVAQAQSATTNEDTVKALTLAATDANGDALTYRVTVAPTHGTLSGTAPNLTYTPAANYNGSDSFNFVANDGKVDSAAAQVSIAVAPVNDAPVATAQALSTNEDSAKTLVLSGSDVDNDALTFRVTTPPAHGTLSGTAPNLTYTPAANYNGSDAFAFVANDGHIDSAAAQVTFTIAAVNDVPVATGMTLAATEDTALPFTLGGSDVDSDSLSFRVTTPPSHGSLSGTAPNLVYTPVANYHGNDSFAFVANDGHVDSAVAAVAIAIASVNDVPVAATQTLSVDAGQTLAIVLSASDVESDPLSYRIVTAPAHGTFTGSAPNLTYTPAANFSGSDSFTFVANDGQADSAPATVQITVHAVNHAPVAAPQTVSVRNDGSLVVTLAGSDADNDTLSFRITASPQHGLLSGTPPAITYTPAAGYVGSDSFAFVANDGSVDSAAASVTVEVTSNINHAPTIVSVPAPAASEGTPYAYALHADDPDVGDVLAYSLAAPTNGATVDAGSGAVAWTPAANLVGPVLDSNLSCHAARSGNEPFVDLTDWLPLHLPGGQAYAIWSLIPGDNTTALVTDNASPSILMGSDTLDHGALEFTFKTTGGDDDYMGFVWNFHDDQHYYRFQWDNGNCGCMAVAKVDSTVAPFEGEVPYWAGEKPGVVVLSQLQIPWDWNVEYRATLEFSPGHAVIRVTHGDQVDGVLVVNDNTFTDGRYGFYNFSQSDVTHRLRVIASDAAPDLVISQLSYLDGQLHARVLNRGTGGGTGQALLRVSAPGTTTPPAPVVLLQQALPIPAPGASVDIDQPVTLPSATTTIFSAHVDSAFDQAECDIGNNDRSAAVFRAAATDLAGLSDSQAFSVQVDDVNSPPAFTSTPPQGVAIGHTLSATFIAADADRGDVVHYELVQAPDGATLGADNGLLEWTPTITVPTHVPFTVRATDLRGTSVTQSFDLFVQHDPVITSQPKTVAYLDANGVGNYRYDIVASDVDGQTLTYALLANPIFMTIDPHTGVVTYPFYPGNTGEVKDVTVEVRDGFGGSARQSFSVGLMKAGQVNHAPVIHSTPPVSATPQQTYTYTIDASDEDGNTLGYRLLEGPAAMYIEYGTHIVTWTPATVQYGTYRVRLEVNDHFGGVAEQSYEVSTIPGVSNQPPSIASRPPFVGKVGHTYQYAVQASDPDVDVLTYALVQGPAGMQIDAHSGLLQWAPTAAGGVSAKIRVSDAQSWVEQTWSINVLDGFVPLAVTTKATPDFVNAGDAVNVSVAVSGAGGDVNLVTTLDGTPLTLDADGKAVIHPTDLGRHTITAVVHDPYDTATSSADVFVRDASDTDDPVAKIDDPLDTSRVTAPTPIHVTATDSHLANWTLSLLPANPATGTVPTVLAQGSSAVTNASVATFDPTQLLNGQYVLTLKASDINGRIATDRVALRVTDEMKIGNFSLTFEDASITLAGMPVRLTRTYDSRRRNEQLDFGYGWSVDYQNVRVQESAPPGFGWQVLATSGGSFTSYCARSNGDRVVTVTLPDGKVHSFRAKTIPECQSLAAFVDVQLAFEPLDGTDSTLEQTDYESLQIHTIAGQDVANIIDPETQGPADPQHYRLTTPEGMVFDLDQGFGIRKITEPNGNTLTYSTNGITHSTGMGIRFRRDGQGRIIEADLPDGGSLVYDYTLDGDLLDIKDQYRQPTTFAYTPLSTHYLKDIVDPRGVRAIRNEYDDAGRLVRTLDADGHAIEYTHDIAGRLEQVRDRRGHLNSFEYDNRGRVLTEINALGETTSHTYDDDGNETSRTDGLGHTTHATFDARGNRLTETDALGHTTTSTYDAKNGLLTQTDIAGQVVMTNTYADGSHALATTTDANGAVTTFTYDTGMFSNNTGELHGITDALNHTTTFTVDFHGWRTQSIDPKGHITTYTFDAAGRPAFTYDSWTNGDGGTVPDSTGVANNLTGRVTATARVRGPGIASYYNGLSKPEYECDAYQNNLCTHHIYDAQGRETQTVFMDGTSESTTFDENGNPTSHTDRNGRVTRMVYDDANRLTETIHPDDTFTSTHYDAAGRVDSVSDERGHVTTYGYDDAGRQTTVTDALGHTTTTAYDAHGRRASVTDALGHVTQYAYDAGGRLTRTTYDDGTFSRTEYDLLGRKTADTDQAGRVTRYTYDLLGRLASVVLPHPTTGANPELVNGVSPEAGTLTTRYEYDELGRKISQTDALGRTTRWYRWQPGGQQEYHDLPGGQRERSQFDILHRLVDHYDFNGRESRYQYDALGRVTQLDATWMPLVTMSYTPAGQVAQVHDGNGTTAYTYDSRDRLKRVTWPDGQTVDYAYDAAGNRTQLTTANQHVDYAFDELNRLQSITAADGGTPNPTVPAASYTYDAVGNRASVMRANGTSTTYAYNSVNRLTGIAHKAGASLLLGLAYTLDPSGLRTAIDESGAINRHVDYTYDAVKRLTSEAVTQSVGNRSTAWTYDAVGNRLTQSKTVTSGTANTAYTYDTDDRLKTETASVTGVVTGTTPGTTNYTYDDQGNLTRKQAPDGTTDYTYDSYNHMVQLTDANGINQYTYTYDGTRLSQTNQANTANAVTTRYLVDPNTAYAQVIEEKTQQGSGIAALSAVYTVGDDRVRMYRPTVAANGSTPAAPASLRYYHADGLGGTRLLTDESAAAVDKYAFEAYGKLDSAMASGLTRNNFLFNGEQWDAVSGLYYLRARNLDPTSGRFTQQDSWEGDPGSPMTIHKYAYVDNDPSSLIDPSGHEGIVGLMNAQGGGQIIRGITSIVASQTARRFAVTLLLAVGTAALGNYVLSMNERELEQSRKNQMAEVLALAAIAQRNLLFHYTNKVAAVEILTCKCMWATKPYSGHLFGGDGIVRESGAYATDIPPWFPNMTQSELLRVMYLKPRPTDLVDTAVVIRNNGDWSRIGKDPFREFYKPGVPGADVEIDAVTAVPNLMLP